MSGEPSVEPLSATRTSPAMPRSRRARWAAAMHVASVSASSRHGIRTVTSGGADAAHPSGRTTVPADGAGGVDMAAGG
jgi:hypothetical protein